AATQPGWAKARPPDSRPTASGCWPSCPRPPPGWSSIPREPVTPEGTDRGIVSPDGREIVAFSLSLGYRRYPATGGDGRVIPGLTPEDRIVVWSRDGRAVVVGSTNSPTLDRVDLATGRR